MDRKREKRIDDYKQIEKKKNYNTLCDFRTRLDVY